MPISPREYQQLVRGPRYRWWRPLVALLLCVGFLLAEQVILGLLLGVILVLSGQDAGAVIGDMASGRMTPVSFGFVIVVLASLIPIAMLSNRIAHGIRPRYLSSVSGGFRWRWLLRCLVITVPLYVAYLGLQLATDWSYQPKPEHWGVLLIMVVVGIPFQSAGEEYAFRGLILQNVGSWFANPKVALVVSIIPSVLLFAAAHGSKDPWVFADLAVFAISSCILAWRTGGLEASVALHATNNVTLMIATILFGGFQDAFVSSSTKGSPLAPLLTLVVNAIVVALILWQAKRTGLQRRYEPAAPALPRAS